ncbi:MAG TPA: hypothetical protein PKC69_11485 [Chitinophagaceae bacterium]|nr:hypothetical protein [Chitinophagaceae bacterium]
MKQILCVVLSCVVYMQVNAQRSADKNTDYQTAAGIKFWDGGGLTAKHFFTQKSAGELVVLFWSNGLRVTGLYELHQGITNVKGLKWYVGGGAHIGFYKALYGNGSFAGIDGVAGLDYKLSQAPVNFSLDWQPAFEFGDGRGFYGGWGGLAVRYTFR